MTHPHKDLIIQLLNDPTLEVERVEPINRSRSIPVTLVDIVVDTRGLGTYLLLEKPKQDVVRYGLTSPSSWHEYRRDKDNVKFTFTADGVLKSAEVIK